MSTPNEPRSIDARPSTIEAVLFDMGGVLVELGALEQLLGLTVDTSNEFWEAWLGSDAVRQYERGLTDTSRFASHLVEEFELTITAEEFVERFRQFPRGLFPGAADLVARVSSRVITGVLSNTNELHWENQRDAKVIQGLCQRSYLSFQLNMVKPDRNLFEHVIADLDVAANQILFIDDNQLNVDGAREAGLCAAVAKGPAAAAAVLDRYQLLVDLGST